MLSAFLKRLLFARQLLMIDGRISVLGTKHVMLPFDVITELESIDPKKTYQNIKKLSEKHMREYASKLGSEEEGLLKVAHNIFETFGLGKMIIDDIDSQKKRCIVKVQGPLSSKKDKDVIVQAVLAGMFSYIFDKQVDAKALMCDTKTDFCEYQVN